MNKQDIQQILVLQEAFFSYREMIFANVVQPIFLNRLSVQVVGTLLVTSY